MDELTHKMNEAGICPQCFKTFDEFMVKKWMVYKEDINGLLIHFKLSELTNEEDDKFGTIIADIPIPPDLERSNFAWMCNDCYTDIKNELKDKKDNKDKDNKDKDEKWIDGLDDWR